MIPDPEKAVAEALEFFRSAELGRVRRFDASNLHLLDSFIKMWLDALRPQCFVRHYFDGSPLQAMEAMVASLPPDAFRSAVLERVRDDIRLRDEYRRKGPGHVAAGYELRMRGLLG